MKIKKKKESNFIESEDPVASLTKILFNELGRYKDIITTMGVHLANEDRQNKSGQNDKLSMIEAPPGNMTLNDVTTIPRTPMGSRQPKQNIK